MGFTEVECVKRMGLGFDALDRVLQLCAPEAPSQLGEQKPFEIFTAVWGGFEGKFIRGLD